VAAADDRDDPAPVVARHVRVHGRVQGVFFRSATRRTARRFGVAGWVRNDVDGTVEAWFEGPPDAVESVEAWVNAGGPPSADVADVEVAEVDPAGAEGFEIRR
jgi:acylphosphatase